MRHWAYGHSNKPPRVLAKMAIANHDGESLLDVDDLDDSARNILRTVRLTIDKLDGGAPDGELSPNGEGRSPSVEKLDSAMELLFGKDGLMEILGTGGDESDDDNPDLKTSTDGLEKTTPEFAALSLNQRAQADAERIADGVFGTDK